MSIYKGEKSKNMGTFIENLSSAGANAAAGTASGIIGQGLSRLFGLTMGPKETARMQWEYQQKMMALQNQYNIQAAEKGQQLAKEYWDYTNAENQVKHLKNAGLNIGLMYGQSGAGGMGASGGGRQEGVDQAQGSPVGMALQAQQLEQERRRTDAETRLIEAQADKTEAEENKISGVDTKFVIKQIEEIDGKLDLMVKEGKVKDSIAVLNEAKTKTEETLQSLNEMNEALSHAKISEAFSIATYYSESAKKVELEREEQNLNNYYLRETMQDRIDAAYYNNCVAIALAAKYKSEKKVNEENINVLVAKAKELNELADKHNWDKETYRKEVEGMIEWWEERVFNERLGIALEFGENIINAINVLRKSYGKHGSKTTTNSTRNGKTITTETKTENW